MPSLVLERFSGPDGLVDLKTDIRTLEREFARKGAGRTAIRRAMFRAMNKAMAKTKTRAKRIIAEERNLPVSMVGKSLRVQRATAAKPEAALIAHGPMVPLYRVKGRKSQTRQGVRVKTGRSQTTLVEGAFIATMANGKRGIFKRIGEPKRRLVRRRDALGRAYTSELPIRELTLPSIPHTLVSDKVVERLQEFSRPEFIRILESQLEFELGKIPGST